jgi:hypothetical protein
MSEEPLDKSFPAEADSNVRGAATQAEGTQDDQLQPDQESRTDELDELRANEVAFSWQASEYVHHHKGSGWYLALFAGLAVLIAVVALMRYWLGIVAFLAMGGAVWVYARRPPRTLTYELTPLGISADGREFPFAEFRSFGVLSDIEWHTIDLDPTKRFSPRMAILFGDDDFDTIVGHLELHLPRVDRDPDLIERATNWLRF